MKRVPVDQRQPGDLFLAGVPGFPHAAIWEAEKAMHPGAPTDFEATHAGVIGFKDDKGEDTVIEAWLDIIKHQDSVACINSFSKYAGHENQLEIWRPTLFYPEGLQAYIKAYGPEKYGVLNLFGFEWVAIVKFLTGRNVENPAEVSDVCSQGALIELGRFQAPLIAPHEHWAYLTASDDALLRNMDPLALRMELLQREA